MHHPALPVPTTQLRRQIHKALDLAVQVAIGDVAAVLAPFAGQDALAGRVGGERGDRGVADEREAALLVQPGAAVEAGGEELVLEGGVDDADDGAVVDEEAD